MKSVNGIAGRTKAVGNVIRNCFFVILIDENNLDNHTYAIKDITAAIEKVKTTSRKIIEYMIHSLLQQSRKACSSRTPIRRRGEALLDVCSIDVG